MGTEEIDAKVTRLKISVNKLSSNSSEGMEGRTD